MNALVTGGGGIIGQHMRLVAPPECTPIFHKQTPCDQAFVTGDLRDLRTLESVLAKVRPDVIVNLAGVNAVDDVELDPASTHAINVTVPAWLARYCADRHRRYIQVSSQAVFDGTTPPYRPNSGLNAVNAYGRQKILAEGQVAEAGGIIARVTFVLGLRPFPSFGRVNPLESMLAASAGRQVHNRFFSVAFAEDVAWQLWRLATMADPPRLVHIGIPGAWDRWSLTQRVRAEAGLPGDAIAVPHESFIGCAARPMNTAWATGAWHRQDFETALRRVVADWRQVAR